MNRLGFTYSEIGYLTFGFWVDLFECYKKQYNFETNKRLFKENEEEPIASLLTL